MKKKLLSLCLVLGLAVNVLPGAMAAKTNKAYGAHQSFQAAQTISVENGLKLELSKAITGYSKESYDILNSSGFETGEKGTRIVYHIPAGTEINWTVEGLYYDQNVESFGSSDCLTEEDGSLSALVGAPWGRKGAVALNEEGRYSIHSQYFFMDVDGGGLVGPAFYMEVGGSDKGEPMGTFATATNYGVLVDGYEWAFDAYAVKDANGNDTNYVKLRDLACVFTNQESGVQFEVEWDDTNKTIALTTGKTYTRVWSEFSQIFEGDQPYTVSPAKVTVNGKEVTMDAINLTDYQNGGYTYVKLRDLGSALGFVVDWDSEACMIVIKTK